MSRKENTMQNAIKTKGTRNLATATKTVITAGGMTGVGIGAYHVKNIVSEVTDNQILGFAAGVATVLVGAVVVNAINKGVDKAFDVKALSTNQPLILEVTPDVVTHVGVVPDNFEFDLDDEEGEL